MRGNNCFLPERTQFDQHERGWRKSGSCSFLPERTQFDWRKAVRFGHRSFLPKRTQIGTARAKL
jgi:hypothetical protein